jgi:cytochrome c oxidase subunit 2
MPMEVVALPQADFDRWVDQERQPRAEPATALAKQGEQLFATKACITCHAISGYPDNKAVAVRGPNLTHFGSRSYVGAYLPNTRENLAHWLRNSPEIKPGNIMATVIKPGFLNEAEIAALTEYLENLK